MLFVTRSKELQRIIKFVEEQRDTAHEQYMFALKSKFLYATEYWGGREQSYRDMFTYLTEGKRPKK